MADASRVIVRSPSDAFIGEISPSDIFAMTRTEEVNGEHSLEITTTAVLQKEMRLLTADHTGKWHEWVVMGEDTDHASGLTPIGTYYAVWSIQHDLALTKVDKMPGTQSPVAASVALTDALSGTKRWKVGTVAVGTTGGASMWYKSGWDALATVVDVWGGEIDATITVANDGTVTARSVDLYSKMGQQTAKRRFDWGYDLKGIRRKVDEAPMAVRIIPRGKGEETGSGGYGRKITIESINMGREWLQNDETAPLYRLPDGSGGWEYPTVVVENGNIEDPQELKDWGLDVLEDYTTPKVTYESDVMQLAQAGMDVTGVALGDAVQCVDKGFSEDGLRVSGRVMKMTVNELDETDIKLTIGHLTAGLAGSLSSISKLTATVAAMNGGSLTAADYLNALLERLNGEINATGGYTYVTQGQGLRTYDKRVSDPLVGSEATKVVEIKGGTIRIADSRTSQGEWDWRTVFVSGHIAADLVTAAKIVTGYIRSPNGTFVDLDNDTAQLGRSDGAHATFNASGMEVFDQQKVSALFAGFSGGKSIIRVGRASNSGNVLMSSDGSVDVRNGSTVMAHFGYGEGKNESGGTSVTPYYSVGNRKSGSVIGNYSVAEGDYTAASGFAAHAEGNITQATGISSHAEGDSTTASGDHSHAEGVKTTASGNSSHAEGESCRATGARTHAEGWDTYASGQGAHAEGIETKAYGLASHSSGAYTTASHDHQFVCGQYNLDLQDALFEVGNGSNSSLKTNAFSVLSTDIINMFTSSYRGRVYVNGSVLNTSDRRLKNHISYIGEDAVAFVRKLRPVLFKWKGEDDLHYGFYAQDVRDADPNKTSTVIENKDDGGSPLTLDYTALIAPLVAYAQSLEKRIEALEEKLA